MPARGRGSAGWPWLCLGPERARRGKRRGGHRRRGDTRARAVIDDAPVGETDGPRTLGGDARLVSHEDEGVSGGVQLGEQRQDLAAGGRVEVSGGLVGEEDRRLG